MYSFWEQKSFLDNDLLIIGGGLMGLALASSVLERYPKKRVVILERGVLPAGASSRNAGMCCCGSVGELVHEIKTIGKEKAIELFVSRYLGLCHLLRRLGPEAMDYKK